MAVGFLYQKNGWNLDVNFYKKKEKGKKICFSNPKNFPKYYIIDPELTYSMPDEVTLNTGIDVLTHAIEAYLSTKAFPLTDLFPINSIKIFFVAALCFLTSTVTSAQDFQGKAIYQTKYTIDMDFAGSGIPADRIQRIKEMMKNQLEKTYTLSFNKTTGSSKKLCICLYAIS